MRVGLLALLAAILTVCVSAKGCKEEFCLVREGDPQATIILAGNPTRAAQFAADELRLHVKKITGAVLPIASGDAKITGPRILIGESAATRALGLRSSDFAEQEYLIRFMPDTLVLMGRDMAPEQADDTPANRPEWVDGKFGKALKFDGRDALRIFECGFDDDAGTMEAWVWMPAQPPPRAGTILRLDGANPWSYHILQRDAKSNRIRYQVYDGKKGVAVASPPLAEGWRHVLATHSVKDGKIELYIDGKSQGTKPYTRTTCAGAFLGIGGIPPKGSGQTEVGNPFVGIIDEVRISKTIRKPKTHAPCKPDEHTTLLLHFDEGRGSPRDSSGNTRTVNPPGFFEPKGTLNAVYDFLERFCDVRWYIPTDLGTVHPTTPTLIVQGEDIRRRPAMRHRWITPSRLYVPSNKDPVSNTDATLWKLRMRIGGEAFWCCHSFGGYYDDFLKEKPDWFAKGYKGKPPQPCFTNAEFIGQVIRDARAYFDGKGKRKGATAQGPYYGLVPMDTGRWCKCDACQAQMDPAEMDNPQFSNGKASNYIWGFVNHVAGEVRKTHPDKWITALAYATYAYYPPKVDLEPNIAVQMCLHTRNWWVPSMEKNDLKVFNGWVEKAKGKRPLYLWLYYNFPAWLTPRRHFNAFPGYFAHTVVKQMKLYHKAGVRGLFMEHSSEAGQSHLLDVPDMYVTLKLCDDPTLDGNRIIDEFFTRFYGAAAGPMRELYMQIEETFLNPANYPDAIRNSPATQHQTEELAWKWLGTDERMARFAKLMDQARAAAHTDVEKQRVALFEKGVWEYMVEGKRKYEQKIKKKQ
ncbi:MAG: DUF4838 domain-containing protein [Planctomycetes bacterium]|nr:DUF4838 domain-containing protein [Planctomycetota bacterium]